MTRRYGRTPPDQNPPLRGPAAFRASPLVGEDSASGEWESGGASSRTGRLLAPRARRRRPPSPRARARRRRPGRRGGDSSDSGPRSRSASPSVFHVKRRACQRSVVDLWEEREASPCRHDEIAGRSGRTTATRSGWSHISRRHPVKPPTPRAPPDGGGVVGESSRATMSRAVGRPAPHDVEHVVGASAGLTRNGAPVRWQTAGRTGFDEVHVTSGSAVEDEWHHSLRPRVRTGDEHLGARGWEKTRVPVLADPGSGPVNLIWPGHVLPSRAVPGGVASCGGQGGRVSVPARGDHRHPQPRPVHAHRWRTRPAHSLSCFVSSAPVPATARAPW